MVESFFILGYEGFSWGILRVWYFWFWMKSEFEECFVVWLGI